MGTDIAFPELTVYLIYVMAKTRSAVFPGSFDPLTNGHVDIVTRALKLFDSVTVAVLSNSNKTALFSVAERVDFIEQQFEHTGGRVSAQSFSGLLVEYARSINTSVIIRGLRAITDYDYEAQMALMNRNLGPEVETVFLISSEENSYISSSIVKNVAALGGDVTRFVPPRIAAALKARAGKG